MSAAAIELTGTNAKALWYLTRSTGLVALILLTATLVIGVVASVGWTTARWPRFLSQSVHRNLSLFCVAFVGLHVVTTVSDGYVPIGFADAFLPFLSPYRPIWIGLGALVFDLLLIVLLSSALRRRIGYASWRFVHWLAYLCWPIALFHALGSGSDSSLPVVLAIDAVCAATVLAAVAWRLATGRTFPPVRRAALAVAALVVVLAVAVFAALGPLRPGWSRRSGTSTALLAQLAGRAAGAGGSTGAPSGSVSAGGTAVPSAPFTDSVTGTQSSSGPDAQGYIRVRLTLQLQNSSYAPLTVVLTGPPAQGGGIDMTAGTVTFGSLHGVVSSLDQGTIVASVGAPDPLSLTLSLRVDQNSGALSGTVTGTSLSHAGDGD